MKYFRGFFSPFCPHDGEPCLLPSDVPPTSAAVAPKLIFHGEAIVFR